MEVKPEHIAAIVAVLVVGYFLVGKRKVPEQKTSRCSRCPKTSEHTDRTISAWRDWKSKFFCNSCHSEWVRSHPRQQHSRGTNGGFRSGCLGALACLVLVPVAVILGWLYV